MKFFAAALVAFSGVSAVRLTKENADDFANDDFMVIGDATLNLESAPKHTDAYYNQVIDKIWHISGCDNELQKEEIPAPYDQLFDIADLNDDDTIPRAELLKAMHDHNVQIKQVIGTVTIGDFDQPGNSYEIYNQKLDEIMKIAGTDGMIQKEEVPEPYTDLFVYCDMDGDGNISRDRCSMHGRPTNLPSHEARKLFTHF